MKNIFSIALGLFLMSSMSVNAQDRERKDGAKMKELRKAFIQEELSLTEDEASKFWPVYDAFKAEKKEIRKELGVIKSEMKANENKTEKDMLSFSSKARELKIKEINLDHQFLESTLPILGVDRTIELRKLERKFKMKMKEKRESRGGKGSSHRGRGNGPPQRN